MANPNFSTQGWVARLLSNARRSGADGALSDPTGGRTSIYQEPHLVLVAGQGREMLADEGSYFTAITPTSGTGIIGHAAPTTFDEAKPDVQRKFAESGPAIAFQQRVQELVRAARVDVNPKYGRWDSALLKVVSATETVPSAGP